MSAAQPRRPGRPRGALRAELSGWMAGRAEFCMADLSKSLGWPLPAANDTIQRALRAGELRVCGQVRTPHAKRPVALYAAADAQPSAMGLGCVMQLWAR